MNRKVKVYMFKAFLIKYAEIVKTKNRYLFKNALRDRIKVFLVGEYYVSKEQGRIFVECETYDYQETVEALQRYLVYPPYVL